MKCAGIVLVGIFGFLLEGCMVGPKYTKAPVPMPKPDTYKESDGWKLSGVEGGEALGSSNEEYDSCACQIQFLSESPLADAAIPTGPPHSAGTCNSHRVRKDGEAAATHEGEWPEPDMRAV